MIMPGRDVQHIIEPNGMSLDTPANARDVFVSHASEDQPFARDLTRELESRGRAVWLDEQELLLGDSLRTKLGEGLATSRVGVIVLSHAFFGKRWTKWELDGLTARAMAGQANVILPVWHGVTPADVLDFSPPLADLFAADSSSEDVNTIVDRIEQVLDQLSAGERPAKALRKATAGVRHSSRTAPAGAHALQQVRHDGDVRDVAFSPDGTRLATVSDDTTARVWDLDAGGYELRRLSHTTLGRAARQLLAVAFSPRGTAIATAGRDKSARVWNVEDGRRLLRVSHRDWVRAVAFSPDGGQLATAGDDGLARVWSVSDGHEVLHIDQGAPLNAVAFSPDGTRLATASDDGSARVWDLSADRQLLQAVHEGEVWAVTFSPDGQRVATASEDGSARVWDLSDDRGEIRRVGHGTAAWAVAFDSSGTRLVTAGDDNGAYVWDLSDGCELYRVAPEVVVWAVTFSPDGNRLATASADHSATIWACDLHHPLGV